MAPSAQLPLRSMEFSNFAAAGLVVFLLDLVNTCLRRLSRALACRLLPVAYRPDEANILFAGCRAERQ